MAIQWFSSVRRFAAVYGAFTPLLIVAAAAPDSCSPPTPTCEGAADPDGDPETLTCLEEKGSVQGTFKVRILRATPDPPAKYTNNWVIRISDASGTPIVGARVEAGLYMPVHQHSQPPPVITANADGTYSVSALELSMVGLFDLTFKLPDLADQVTFRFDVQ